VRLYLSSFRLGTAPEHLVRLCGIGARAAVIANAIDGEPADDRVAKVAAEVRALQALGLWAEELDLRDCVGASPGQVSEVLAEFDVLWVRGGNVFVLRNRLAQVGADVAIVDQLRRDSLVYAGYSAGPCVLGPALVGLERVDDASAPARLGLGEALRSGLGVLRECVVPHVGSPTHPDGAGLGAVAEQYVREGTPHVVLRDGEALVVEGEDPRLVGHPATVTELIEAYGV
jgi:dipeptidase E